MFLRPQLILAGVSAQPPPQSEAVTTLFAVYNKIRPRFLRKRMQHFLEAHRPTDESLVVIDVGGRPDTWVFAEPRPDVILMNLSVADLALESGDVATAVVGDARRPPLRSGAVQVAYSNSVIEHVGTRDDQQLFADSLRNLAPRLWVQTPAKEFPFEPHYLTPFVHWLPAKVQRRILRNFTVWGLLTRPDQVYVERVVDQTRLLTRREFEALFPDCDIVVERTLGLPRCYIAVRS